MYFNKEALLTVVNDRIEKYQERVKSIRKNFNKENNQEKIIQLLININMLEARINELSTMLYGIVAEREPDLYKDFQVILENLD